MDKLEKTLWGCAPYGLKMRLSNSPDYNVFTLMGIVSEQAHLRLRTKSVYSKNLETCVPILRPLSDLTKPIKHNGEVFTPIQKLSEYSDGSNHETEWIEHLFDFDFKIHEVDFMQAPLRLAEKLLEWKFDIFNLIEENKAVPVTEDFNPYE